jgi:ribose 5-phosphate isomerase A
VSDAAKRAAASRALDLVEDGMRLGLGTGSTAALFVAALGERVASGLDVIAVPTSEATHRQAEALGIRLATLEEEPDLDLTIDGADEIDGTLRLIKGGGGALLREKIVALASRRTVIIVDDTKRVETLGAFPLPVEIVRFGAETTIRRVRGVLRDLALPEELAIRRREDGGLFSTDAGQLILDLKLSAIPEPERLADALKMTVGVIEHGLFVAIASDALIGTASGVIEIARS